MNAKSIPATALYLGTLLGCGAPLPMEGATQAREDQQAVQEEAGPAPIATLALDGDYTLKFILLTGKGGVRAVGVAEEIPEGAPPLVDALGMKRASPLEIFRAFSRAEVQAPAVLEELYGKAQPLRRERARGWAIEESRALVAAVGDGASVNADVACSDAWFASWVDDSLPSDHWRMNQNGTEATWGQYCDYSVPGTCGSCTNASRKKVDHERHGVSEWRAYSCLRSSGPAAHSYSCPAGSGTLYLRVAYLYRDPNDAGWSTAYISPAAEYANQNRTYSWHFNSGSNWDWQHAVRGALPSGGDKVDLYTGWR